MSTDTIPNNIILIDRKITQNQQQYNITEESSTITNEKTARENDPTVREKTKRVGRGGVVNIKSINNREATRQNDLSVKGETSHEGVVKQPLNLHNYRKKSNRYDDRKKPSGELCRQFLSEGSCRFSENCRYLHVDAHVVGAYKDAPNRAYNFADDRTKCCPDGERRNGEYNRCDGKAGSGGAELLESRQPGWFKMSSRPCRFYAAGYCVRGKNCSFSHDKQSAEDARQQNCSELFQEDECQKQCSRATKRPVKSAGTPASHTTTQELIHGRRDSQMSSEDSSHKSLSLELSEISGKQQPVRPRGNDKKIHVAKERAIQCRFLRSGYCRMGNKCKYSHELRNDDKYSDDRYKDSVKKRCIQDKECNQDCSEDPAFTDVIVPHDVHRTLATEGLPIQGLPIQGLPIQGLPIQRLPIQGCSQAATCRPKVKLSDGAAARQLEIDQLRKRFPECIEAVGQDGSSVVKFVFTPTDPDWPYDVRNINMEATFPEKYPSEMMSVLVSEDDGQMPETVRRMVTESLEDWITSRYKRTGSNDTSDEVLFDLAFRPLLRWFDKNALVIFTNALKQLKREKMAEAAGIQFIPASQLRKIYNSAQHEIEAGTMGGSHDAICEIQTPNVLLSTLDQDNVINQVSEEKIQSDDPLPNDCDTKQLDGTIPQGARGHGTTGSDNNQQGVSVRRGTEVTLQGFNIGEGVATVLASRVTVVVACQRCSRTSEVKSPCGRTNSVTCAYCHSVQLVRFNACIAHQFSSVIGYMDLNGCAPVDLVLADSTFVVGCLKCDKEVKMESFAPGQVNTSWCLHCHQKLVLSTNSARFLTLPSTTSQLDLASACIVEVKRPVRAVKDPLIQEGKPLPANGTCKHYKKSFRWLRFPCCGKVYPCDICHDEKEDHEMKFANRMICGYCAKEQPYSSEGLCIGCQSSLTNRTTAHWEGGTGCRDRIKMSRNDDKKYANGSKTISRSSQAKKDMGKKTTRLRHAV